MMARYQEAELIGSSAISSEDADGPGRASALSAGFTRFSDEWLRGVLTPDAINSMGALRAWSWQSSAVWHGAFQRGILPAWIWYGSF